MSPIQTVGLTTNHQKGSGESAAAATSTTPGHSSEDVALICGKTEDGKGLAILRKRKDRIEAGVARPLEHGKPILGEAVQLKQRKDSPIFDVEVLASGTKPEANDIAKASVQVSERGHPARVSTDTYRSGWDAIWKSAPKKRMLN